MRKIKDYSLYLVITEEYGNGKSALGIAASAIIGGIDIIQMREKNKPRPELIKLGKELSRLCKNGGVTFIVNDDPSIAKEVDADGVHLGQEDMKKHSVGAARKVLGRDKAIGISTHSIETFRKACTEDVNYIAYGPVFPTEIKDNCAGTEDVGKIVAMTKKPVFFIGGINLENVDSLFEKGARNISLIRAITQADDVESAVKSFKKKIEIAFPHTQRAIDTLYKAGCGVVMTMNKKDNDMEKLPELGKIHPEFFNRVIYPRLGAKDKSVLVKPQHGVDFGVVDLGDKVMVLSTDPFYIARELGVEKAAWFAVHILASDVAVSGIRPRYLSVDLNLPPEMTEDELVRMWKAVDSECKALGIAVVTGHTARYAGCNYPMVGGATVFGIGSKSKLIKPKVNIGDAIIVTKGPAIETTGLMSAYFPKYLEAEYGKNFVKKAQDVYYQMSTVKDALIAAKAGGVTAMHDATECGVFGGLYEMAAHSNAGMNIYIDDMIIQDEVKKTCKCFDIDPYISISEGTLLAAAKKKKAKAVVRVLKDEGIPASIVGEAVSADEGMHIINGNAKYKLEHPRVDPFWGKFEEYLKK